MREWQEVRGEWLEASGKSSEREEGRALQLMSVEEVAASAAPFHAMVPAGDVLQEPWNRQHQVQMREHGMPVARFTDRLEWSLAGRWAQAVADFAQQASVAYGPRWSSKP